MRGTVAKSLREVARKTAQPTRYVRDAFGAIRCVGFRNVVAHMKKSYYKLKREGSQRGRSVTASAN